MGKTSAYDADATRGTSGGAGGAAGAGEGGPGPGPLAPAGLGPPRGLPPAAGPGRAGPARSRRATGPARPAARPPAPPVRDLRGLAGTGPRTLGFAAGDLVVVSGLPGSGKSTLLARVVRTSRATRTIDSQDVRERWERRLPRLPYAVFRPLVRLAHYAALHRALRSGASLVVHDCGTQRWVRHWIAAEARRRGSGMHLLLLDVRPALALAGQRVRGRTVSRYAFHRHRATLGRLLGRALAGDLPRGCASVVLLDRPAADALRRLDFLTPAPPRPRGAAQRPQRGRDGIEG
ncbi:AAA family ATPase [Streptomyces sp. NPDC049954]|uniref:AAA family ATPase n=1 Tax=Streptomyces sp. NPDC049954 TaxID=3155779 RepID=UPI003438B01A